MTGPHPAAKCFLRGLSFQPKELQQRINLYNKQHGMKPPVGQEPANWKPRSLNPTHQHTPTKVSTDPKKTFSRPFENYSQKNNGKSVNFLATDQINETQHDISNMITNQLN